MILANYSLVTSKGRICQPTGGASFKAQLTGRVVLFLKLRLSPSWFQNNRFAQSVSVVDGGMMCRPLVGTSYIL